eukprot:TRINITY_DN1276_c0_g1_i6.p1 TRINITY_DN1276_c0_g1~~TRINITY_DN1276_c0_g1_i6.p1  ORF type:complete len:126 (-),score=4.42 TRINITY_DN1276_c0_g1_i6:275-652(-)
MQNILYGVPISKSKFEHATQLTKRISKFSVLVDSAQVFSELEDHAKREGIQWSVFLKVDSGYHRAGVDPTKPDAIELALSMSRSVYVNLEGIYSHSGHAYSTSSSSQIIDIAQSEMRIMRELKDG